MRKIALLVALTIVQCAQATDLMRFGGSAGDQAVAGIVGLSPDPLSALNGNPALLSSLPDGSVLSLSLLSVDSEFTSSTGEVASAESGPGLLPQFALKRSLGNSCWSWGAGLSVTSAMQAEFEFADPPGTLGVSYGRQIHRSEFIIASLSGALSYQLAPKLAAGISLDVLYNRNRLKAPYIFQSHPVLAGLKVLVDLEADDIQLATTLGLDYRPSDNWAFSLAYSPRTKFSADGDLSGNLGQLGLGIQETFAYQAQVDTAKPATWIFGASWQATPDLRLGFQYDVIEWDAAFRDLPIALTQGSNADLNAFLGEDSILDTAPLNWKNQGSLHLGLEYQIASDLILRLGLEDSEVPVPAATITPMTAAILDKAFSAGLSIRLNETLVDVAYRYSDADTFRIIDSGLLGDEYDNTSQTLDLHTFTVSFSF